MPGMSISYQGKVIFPRNSLTEFLNVKNVKANVPVFTSYQPSDATKKNYRYITFQATSSTDTLKLMGITLYNQYVEETITLDGVNPVESANMYKQFQVVPNADVEGLTIGNTTGMSDLVFYDGTPTTHRVIVSGGDSVTYTVYGLLNPAPMSKAQLDVERFQLDAGLTGGTTTTGAVKVYDSPQRMYLDVTATGASTDITWYWTTESTL